MGRTLDPTKDNSSLNPFSSITGDRLTDKLSFGIISNDLYARSASPFLYALVNELIKLGHTVNIYTDRSKQYLDFRVQADNLLGIANEAISFAGLDINESRKLIASKKHDVIIDTEGLTNLCWSIELLNKRLAPFQLTWLGYPGTTGNANIDFLVADKYYAPENSELMTEDILELSACSFSRYPMEDLAANIRCPSLERGFVTFGSLNNSYKVTPLTIKVWARIMSESDRSEFWFIRSCYSSRRIQENLIKEFEKYSIDRKRIKFIDNNALNRNYLDCYNDLDLCLDTIPLTGGVSTLDSLWMGVPVVTIEGINTHQKVSSQVLHYACLHELVCTDEQGMIETSLRIAKDTTLRTYWRNELRANLQQTDLFNPAKTANSLVSALRKTCGLKSSVSP